MPPDTPVPDDDSTTQDWGERPALFDIEREDAVLAQAVEPSVPMGRRSPAQQVPVGPGAFQASPTPMPAGQGSRPVQQSVAQQGVRSGGSGARSVAPAPGPGAQPHDAAALSGWAGLPPGTDERVAHGARNPERPMPVGSIPERRPDLHAFPMVRRGYDPAEVDAFMVRSEQAVARATARAEAAERQMTEALGHVTELRMRLREAQERQRSGPPPSIQALGERVSSILNEAWEAAEELRREAGGAADRARAEADEIARTAEAEARRRAAAVVAEADEHRRRVVQELNARRAEHEAIVARLDSQRSAAVGELERLQALLQRALSPVVAPGTGAERPDGPASTGSAAPAPSGLGDPGGVTGSGDDPGRVAHGSSRPASGGYGPASNRRSDGVDQG